MSLDNIHSSETIFGGGGRPNKDENVKEKAQELVVNQQPLQIASLSKSLPSHRVRFSCDVHDDDNNLKKGDDDKSVKKKELTFEQSRNTPQRSFVSVPPPLTPLRPAIHRPDKNEITKNVASEISAEDEASFGRLGFGFSDSVLAFPNLPQHGQKINKKEDDSKRFEQEEKHGEAEGDEILRRSPKTNLMQGTDSNCNHNFKEMDEQNEKMAYNREHVDENNNVVLWPAESEKKLIKHASYIFHKDRRAELQRMTKLMPRGREYVIFNIFTDIARLFGFRGKSRKQVKFPEEFLEKYAQQGDVAGKDRFVPTSKQPFVGLQTASKKRKLSAVYSSWTLRSTEFVPRVNRVDDINKCELCCEKYCVSCDCFRGPSKGKDVSAIMNGYLADLNMASLFLHAHTTRTFEAAMSSLEFLKFHIQPSKLSVASANQWALNHSSKQHLGILSGSIWVFTYCIRTIIQQARLQDTNSDKSSLPSESNFRKIMEQYATLCLTLQENVKIVLQYGHNFYNFCKECIRILKVLQVHIGFKREISLKPPLKRGDGLDLNRKLSQKEIVRKAGVEVMVARKKESSEDLQEEELEWKNFADLSGNDKAACLKHLLNVTSEGMNMVQTQLRFLLDDIVDSVKNTEEADLLFLLADMFDRIKFLENVGIRRMKPELEQISRTTSEFCNDFQSFVDHGQHIIKRYVEYRDMVHLSYEFLVNGLNLESVSEAVPPTIFNRKKRLGCCGVEDRVVTPKKGKFKKLVDKFQPKYQAIDFFRVYNTDAVNSKAEIFTNRFNFTIDASKFPIQDMIPSGASNVWGEIDLVSPRVSFEEYADRDEDDDDDDAGGGGGAGGAGDKEKSVETLKPILVSTNIPVPSPRGSVDVIGVATDEKEKSVAESSATAAASSSPSKVEQSVASDAGESKSQVGGGISENKSQVVGGISESKSQVDNSSKQ